MKQVTLLLIIFSLNNSVYSMEPKKAQEDSQNSQYFICDETYKPLAECPDEYIGAQQAAKAFNIPCIGVYGLTESDSCATAHQQEHDAERIKRNEYLAKKAAPYTNPKDIALFQKKFILNEFHAAVRAGNLPVVQKFLAQKVEVNQQVENGYTALHWASRYGHLPIVKALVQAQANLEIPSTSGKRAIHFAAAWYQLPIVQFLAKAGADLNACDNNKNTALHCAALTGDASLIQFLINQKVRYTSSLNNKTPLVYAQEVVNDTDPCVRRLLLQKEKREGFTLSIQLLTAYQEVIKSTLNPLEQSK